jgi:hypothetical protein
LARRRYRFADGGLWRDDFGKERDYEAAGTRRALDTGAADPLSLSWSDQFTSWMFI